MVFVPAIQICYLSTGSMVGWPQQVIDTLGITVGPDM